MDNATLVRAILDEPGDDTLRLVFADWLQEHGEEARAHWIRASCALAQSNYRHPEYTELVERVRETFARCVPDWWEVLVGVTQNNHRGLFRFAVRSKAAVGRVRKARWIPEAFADGWLEHVAVEWSDGVLAREVAKWSTDLRSLPLSVRPAPQIDDDGLRVYLDAPRLVALDLPGHAARVPSVRRLGLCEHLRVLRLDGVPDAESLPAVFEQIGLLTGLRRLTIDGYQRPTDEDLLPLGGLHGLRELHLIQCQAVTDRALLLFRSLTQLRLLRLWNCPGISDAGLAGLRETLPALEVVRI